MVVAGFSFAALLDLDFLVATVVAGCSFAALLDLDFAVAIITLFLILN